MIPALSRPARCLIAVLALLTAMVAPQRLAAADTGAPQYYELRVYTTQSDAQIQRIGEYWEKAAVPAYNRLGIRPIGVFTELQDATNNKVYVLIPFATPGAFAEVPAKLAADAAYQAAAADYLNTPKSDPTYQRFESSLLCRPPPRRRSRGSSSCAPTRATARARASTR